MNAFRIFIYFALLVSPFADACRLDSSHKEAHDDYLHYATKHRNVSIEELLRIFSRAGAEFDEVEARRVRRNELNRQASHNVRKRNKEALRCANERIVEAADLASKRNQDASFSSSSRKRRAESSEDQDERESLRKALEKQALTIQTLELEIQGLKQDVAAADQTRAYLERRLEGALRSEQLLFAEVAGAPGRGMANDELEDPDEMEGSDGSTLSLCDEQYDWARAAADPDATEEPQRFNDDDNAVWADPEFAAFGLYPLPFDF